MQAVATPLPQPVACSQHTTEKVTEFAPTPNCILSKNKTIYLYPKIEPIATLLAAQLQHLGFIVAIVEKLPATANQIIFLAGLQKFDIDTPTSIDAMLAVNRQMFLDFKQIAPHMAVTIGCIITLQDTGGSFGINHHPHHRAWLGGITGLVKTARQEWPKVNFKCIDAAQEGVLPQQLVSSIVNEILFGNDKDIEVGLPGDGSRLTVQLCKMQVPHIKLAYPSHPVIIVSGGARGITAACLIEFAKKQSPAQFILLGRTPLTNEDLAYEQLDNAAILRQTLIAQAKETGLASPKTIEKKLQNILALREIKQTLAELKQHNSTAQYISVDIQNQAELMQCLNAIRIKYGRIDGVIHAAAVLADKLIQDQTPQQFASVFNTKVMGLKNLLTATETDALTLLITFSSVAARFGNKGQVAYAMANEVINKVIQAERRRRGDHCLVKSINWGAWAGGLVSPLLQQEFAQRGITLISLADGSRLFVAELTSNCAQAEIIVGQPLTIVPEKLEIMVNAKKDVYLTSHALQNVPIVPIVLGFEWMLRLLKQQQQDILAWRYHNLKILKGIKLTNFYTTTFNFAVRQQDNNIILQDNKSVYYSLHFNKINNAATGSALPDFTQIFTQSTTWPYTVEALYHELLFHGSHFYSIEKLESLSTRGGSAILTGMSAHKSWPSQDWLTDVVLMDGIMQLAGTWCFVQLKQYVMPVSIGEIILYQSGIIKKQVHCLIACKIINRFKVIINAVCLDHNNNKIVELREITMIAFGNKDNIPLANEDANFKY